MSGVLRTTPLAFVDGGYCEVPEDQAQVWSNTHYQEGVPRYGSGWFPAYVRVPKIEGQSFPVDLQHRYLTRADAEAGMAAYIKQEGL
jgi:hypothetical protein